MAAAIGVGRFVYTPILPYMADALGWRASEAGMAASANFAGYLLGALAASRAIRPDRQRAGLMIALLVSALTTSGTALSASFPVIAAARFTGGVASAYVIVLASTIVLARLAKAGHSRIAPLHFAGVGTGVAASALLVAAMTQLGAGWNALWIGAGGLALLATAGVWWLVPSGGGDGIAPMAQSSGAAGRGLPLLVAAYGLFGFGYVITATFIVAMVRGIPDARGLEAMIWIAFGGAAIPSVSFWSGVGRRLGPTGAFAVACVSEAVGVAASTEWLTPPGLLTSAVLLGGTFMGLTALGLTAAREAAGGAAQRAMALLTASFAAGQMFGPVAAGLLADRLGSMRAPTLLAASALLVAAVLAVLSGRGGATRAA